MSAVVCQGQWFSILANSTSTEFVRTGDEDYAINVERIPWRALRLIAASRLLDARVIAALYMARGLLKGEAR